MGQGAKPLQSVPKKGPWKSASHRFPTLTSCHPALELQKQEPTWKPGLQADNSTRGGLPFSFCLSPACKPRPWRLSLPSRFPLLEQAPSLFLSTFSSLKRHRERRLLLGLEGHPKLLELVKLR